MSYRYYNNDAIAERDSRIESIKRTRTSFRVFTDVHQSNHTQTISPAMRQYPTYPVHSNALYGKMK